MKRTVQETGGLSDFDICKRKFLQDMARKRSLGNAIDMATMAMLKEVYESEWDKNVVCSPLGALTLLAMIRTTASEDIRQEINKLLDGSEETELSPMYQSLNVMLSGMDAAVLAFANKICVSDKLTLTEEFHKNVKAFSSEVAAVNFKVPKTEEDINNWIESVVVETYCSPLLDIGLSHGPSQSSVFCFPHPASRKTRGIIQNAIAPGALQENNIACALFNVIFFKGHWKVPFEKDDTKEKDFYIDLNTTVKKPTMHLVVPLLYTECREFDFRMVELPYQEKGFRMLVILPNKIDGLPAVLEKLATHGVLNVEANLRLSGVDVILDLPKFDVTSDLNLKSVLREMGVTKIFDKGSEGIVNEMPVKVSKIFQKAFIKVDEEGATAGAFTGICFSPLCAHYVSPQSMQFKVDHPFMYLIMFEDNILFAGTYAH